MILMSTESTLNKTIDRLLSIQDDTTKLSREKFSLKVRMIRDLIKELFMENVSGMGHYDAVEADRLCDAGFNLIVTQAMMLPPPALELLTIQYLTISRTVWAEMSEKNPELQKEATEGLVHHLKSIVEKLPAKNSS